jgi:hypothetical protein
MFKIMIPRVTGPIPWKIALKKADDIRLHRRERQKIVHWIHEGNDVSDLFENSRVILRAQKVAACTLRVIHKTLASPCTQEKIDDFFTLIFFITYIQFPFQKNKFQTIWHVAPSQPLFPGKTHGWISNAAAPSISLSLPMHQFLLIFFKNCH